MQWISQEKQEELTKLYVTLTPEVQNDIERIFTSTMQRCQQAMDNLWAEAEAALTSKYDTDTVMAVVLGKQVGQVFQFIATPAAP
jgi:hypothetical protein